MMRCNRFTFTLIMALTNARNKQVFYTQNDGFLLSFD